jgi:hypothetical protein
LNVFTTAILVGNKLQCFENAAKPTRSHWYLDRPEFVRLKSWPYLLLDSRVCLRRLLCYLLHVRQLRTIPAVAESLHRRDGRGLVLYLEVIQST